MPKIITVSASITYNEHFKAAARGRFDDLLSELEDRAELNNAEPAWGTLKLSSSLDYVETRGLTDSSEVMEELVTWRGEVEAVIDE